MRAGRGRRLLTAGGLFLLRGLLLLHSNVAGLVESPGERVLVIFGAGHLGWLRQNVMNDPTLQLRKLAAFVR